MCDKLKPWTCVGDVIGDVASDAAAFAADSGLGALANGFKESAEWTVEQLTTAWLNVPAPDVESASSPAVWLDAHLEYFVVATTVAAVLLACYKVARTGKQQHFQDLFDVLVRVVVTSACAGTLIGTGIKIGDLYSDWILKEADLDLSAMFSLTAITSPGLLIVIALLVIVIQIVQLGLMMCRNGMLVYVSGVLPLSAAASSLGRDGVGQWYPKMVGWATAFVLYKATAATIYAGSFKMASADQDAATQVSGVFVMLLAIFALPGLMRLVVPATAVLAAGNAASVATVMVGSAVANGAVAFTGGAAAMGATGLSGAAGASGLTGGSGPTGASSTGSAGRGGAMGSAGSDNSPDSLVGNSGSSGDSAGSSALSAPTRSGLNQSPGGASGGSSPWMQPLADGATSLGRTFREVADGADDE